MSYAEELEAQNEELKQSLAITQQRLEQSEQAHTKLSNEFEMYKSKVINKQNYSIKNEYDRSIKAYITGTATDVAYATVKKILNDQTDEVNRITPVLWYDKNGDWCVGITVWSEFKK